MTPSAPLARRAGAALLLLGTAALATACGSARPGPASGASAAGGSPSAAAPASSAPPASAPATTPQTPPSSPAVPACATTSLSAAIPTGAGGAAAGSTYYPLNLANTSGKPCYLYGYPGVSFVTAAGGSQIGAAASRNPVVSPAVVVLGAGQTAHVTLQVVNALNYSQSQCKPVSAHWLKIYPPGQYTALYLKFSALACSATLPAKLGSPLSVDAVKSGAGRPGGGL